MNEDMREVRRDPELAAVLRMVEPEPPLEQVDWEALRASIVSRAELPLARRRSGSARLVRWTRRALPLAAAASIALAVWLTEAPPMGPEAVAEAVPGEIAPGVTPEAAFDANLSDQEFQLLVSGRANADALLLVAIGES